MCEDVPLFTEVVQPDPPYPPPPPHTHTHVRCCSGLLAEDEFEPPLPPGDARTSEASGPTSGGVPFPEPPLA